MGETELHGNASTSAGVREELKKWIISEDCSNMT
jgi:hypothetical protein